MIRLTQRCCAAVSLCLASAIPFAVYAENLDISHLPQPLHQRGVTFMTGGVGPEESQALRTEALHWPLVLRFTRAHTAYLSDVHVQIMQKAKSGKGSLVLRADSRGPYMLIRLQPGKYTVKAVYNGHAQMRTIALFRRHRQELDFFWSEG